MALYEVQEKYSGNVIESGLTYAEATQAVRQFEKDDIIDGTYSPNLYAIEECSNIEAIDWINNLHPGII